MTNSQLIKKQNNAAPTTVWKDLLIICSGCIAVFLIAVEFDAFERLAAWSVNHDTWKGDEIISVLVLLPFALGVFAWRRWRDLKAETDRRQQAEESVRTAAESYRQLVESAEEMIYKTDAAGRFILCNPALAARLKYSEADLLGLNYFQVIKLDQRKATREFYQRQFATQTRNTYFELTVVSRDGKEVLVGQNVQLMIQNGRVNGFQAVARDITERKRAEDAERKMEEYRNLFKMANDSILIINAADGIVLDVNDKAVETYGRSREEFIGQNILTLVEDTLKASHCLAQIVSEQRVEEFENTHFRADGTPIHFLINPSLIEYQGRQAVLSINRDITERKKAAEKQKSLQNERDQLLEQLQLQIEVMPNAFMMMDATYRTTYWNPAAERIFGFTREEVLGTYGHKLLIRPETYAFAEEILAQITSGESVSSSFTENVAKDGRLLTCEWHTAPLKKADGTFYGIMAMGADITERVRVQRALEEANQRALNDYGRLIERIAALGQTLGNARDLISIFRALRDFALVSVPCDGLVISLYDEEKKARQPAYLWTDHQEFDPKELSDVPVGDGMTGRAIKSGEVIFDNDFQKELRFKTPVMVGECNEDSLPRSALTAPMTVMGRTVGCVELQSYQKGAFGGEHATAMRMAASLAGSAVENVSLIERERAMEEQSRQSQKMDSIGQLAGGVAHDFNNLLTAITGYSDLALRKLPKDAAVRNNIEEIKKAGLRAASLTSQLLAFSRKQVMQPKVLDLNYIVSDMDKMLRRLIGEHIDLVSRLHTQLGRVKADPGQIEQVIMNLVVNARDAMPGGGQITIETVNKYLDEDYADEHVSIKPGHYVVLAVSDTGAGMDADTQKRIFEPFFTTKEVGRGTGLGLSTVYGIVNQSGGNIWVYSEVGRGTTFKIYLPRVDQVDEAQDSAAPTALPKGTETVLLVEDEEMVRTLAQEILEDSGYRVEVATNGKEGLRVCQEFSGHIDLIITDIVMPEMSGRELAEQVALMRPETKVLFMSGYTDDAIVRHGILEQNMRYMQKPFLPADLALKAREILDQRAT